MYFGTKNTLKNNRNHTFKQALRARYQCYKMIYNIFNNMFLTSCFLIGFSKKKNTKTINSE
jgi:hypothetical protein